MILRYVVQGASLVALTVFVHAMGSLFLLWSLTKFKPHLKKHEGLPTVTLFLTWLVGSLVLLHMLEIMGWGFFYYWLELFADLEEAVYYSLVTYTTVGYGDVVLSKEFRLLGTSEALVGILMTAWSTALLIGVLNRFHERILQKIAPNPSAS